MRSRGRTPPAACSRCSGTGSGRSPRSADPAPAVLACPPAARQRQPSPHLTASGNLGTCRVASRPPPTVGLPGGEPNSLSPPLFNLPTGGLEARELSLQARDFGAQLLSLRAPRVTVWLTAAITAAGAVTSAVVCHFCLPCWWRPPYARVRARSDCFSEPMVASTAVGS